MLTWLVIGPVSRRLQQRERRLRIEHLDLAGVFQRKPHLRTVRRGGNVRAERARLLDLANDLVVGDGDDRGLGRERRADIAVFAVGRGDRHARSICHDDPRLLLVGRAVEHGDVVLAPHHHPDFPAVGREERLVRRASDVSDVLDRVGRGIDEIHRIRADRHHRKGAVIGRKPQAVYKQLAAIERTEARRQRIAEPDHAEELVVDGIGHRDGVGKLLSGVDAIAMADRNVGIGGSAWDLSAAAYRAPTRNYGCQKSCQIGGALHITAPWLERSIDSIRSAARVALPLAKVRTAAAADRQRDASPQSPVAGSR